ncbi:GntR family transcriptional regulator [Deinococcus sp. KSM4-11]|uniref:GntR family transcriptional regulator n=1 Tax=Deinococcus sp. KSM4-11 TaxID=2568654 RepID=UPI0010A4B380|nr:GntR family transcriptional regulator [Deinococcus sp. KSM4-11]THF85225.1 GntR family transcriptional regulator [Deinococcus sp. KSM4-11]
MTRADELLDTLKSGLDPSSAVPLYAQVRGGLVHAIERGLLRPGDPLPTVRALAAELNLAVNTVAKAYTALRHEGVTENRAGAGTTVAAAAWAGGLHHREALERWRQHTHDLLAAGIEGDRLRTALDEVLGARQEHNGQDSGL